MLNVSIKRIIIDTDPGIDDAMAILFAFLSPELQVEGLTTVFGNTETETGTVNALRLVELVGRHSVPVAHGAERSQMFAPSKPTRFSGGRNGGGTAQTKYLHGVSSCDTRNLSQPRCMMVVGSRHSPGELTASHPTRLSTWQPGPLSDGLW